MSDYRVLITIELFGIVNLLIIESPECKAHLRRGIEEPRVWNVFYRLQIPFFFVQYYPLLHASLSKLLREFLKVAEVFAGEFKNFILKFISCSLAYIISLKIVTVFYFFV